jgi:hypothetical protein
MLVPMFRGPQRQVLAVGVEGQVFVCLCGWMSLPLGDVGKHAFLIAIQESGIFSFRTGK